MVDGNSRTDDNDDDDDDGKSVGGKKILLFIVLAILLLGGIGAGLYFSGMLGGGEATEEKAEAPAAAPAATTHGASGGASAPQYDAEGNLIGGPVYYEMPEFLVNLSTTGKKASFLKMKVTLELPGPEAIAVIDANKPRLQDVFNTYLRELRASDLSGSAGIYRLREELLMRVNTAIQPNKVNDILFSEIIVQ
jgi:flagellar FliL protein